MNDMPSTSFEPMKPLVAALVRTNQALVGQFEKWVELRLDSLRAYVDLGLAQTKIALMTTDAQSASEFADSQFAVLSFVGYRMMEDGARWPTGEGTVSRKPIAWRGRMRWACCSRTDSRRGSGPAGAAGRTAFS
ncbi:MAG: hypothetical protein IPM75_10100 [Candidatus Competibacteraceae bacterium]|nr:hypothetical protein [Candidatus Competibacteraceae bacterium]